MKNLSFWETQSNKAHSFSIPTYKTLSYRVSSNDKLLKQSRTEPSDPALLLGSVCVLKPSQFRQRAEREDDLTLAGEAPDRWLFTDDSSSLSTLPLFSERGLDY